jgi:hypothetical protein
MKKKFFLSLFTNVFFAFLGKTAIHLKELYLTHQKKKSPVLTQHSPSSCPLALFPLPPKYHGVFLVARGEQRLQHSYNL